MTIDGEAISQAGYIFRFVGVVIGDLTSRPRAVLKDRTTEEEINKICNAYFFALKNLFNDE